MNSIYGIGYDFHRKNGLYLMFHEKQGEQLSGSELIPLHIRMMESNQIPHLLPLSIEELDFKVRLYYNITSKRDLTTYLKNHSLTSFEFYQLFIHIITTLEQSKLYMLNEHQYVLQEDFIFVGKEPKELFLTYLPIGSIDKEKSTLEELKSLMMRVVEKVESLQGSEQKHIAQYVEDPAFSLSGLKELLTDLQKLRPTPYGYQASPNQDPMYQGYEPYQAVQGEFAQQPYPRHHQEPNQLNEPIAQPSVKKKAKKKKSILAGLALTQRQKVYIFVLGLLSLTIVWKVFEAIPNKEMLITSGILSVIIVVAVLVLVLYRPKEQEMAETETAATSEQAMNPAYAGGYMHPGNGYYQQNGQQYPPNGYQYYQTEAQPMQPKQDVPQNIHGQTPPAPVQQTQVQQRVEEIKQPDPVVEQQPSFSLDTNLLVENDDTVLLDDDGDFDSIDEANTDAYVEIDRDGEIERITLSDSHFTVGRNETAVDYLEDSVGVSRIHLEFIKIDNQYGVKDLGSRNGTKLNGEPLVPYKIYALNEEDVISFGKVDYRFKWE